MKTGNGSTRWAAAWLVGALCWAGAAQAQFTMVPAPVMPEQQRSSEAEIDREYRIDAARHLYAAYPMRVLRGKFPPLAYAVMITETQIDATGQVLKVEVVRPPAGAKEVTPWVVQLIQRASPFPVPARFQGGVVYREIWLVDKGGQFQVDTLTEGQR
jgi:periplasmic protein TonB